MCRSYDASFLSAIVSPSLSLSLGCPVYVHASSTFVFVGLVCNFCFEAGYFALTMSPRVSYFVCVSRLLLNASVSALSQNMLCFTSYTCKHVESLLCYSECIITLEALQCVLCVLL